MFAEGRRQWIKKLLGGVFGIIGLATLGSTIGDEEAHAIAHSLVPNSTELSGGPCNFTCTPTYCPSCHGTYCPNCHPCYQATYIPNASSMGGAVKG